MLNIKFDKRQFDEWFDLFKTNIEFMIMFSILLYPSYLPESDKQKFILLPSGRIKQIEKVVIVEK